MSETCPGMRPDCASRFARLEERLAADQQLDSHRTEELTASINNLTHVMETLAGRVHGDVNKLWDAINAIERSLSPLGGLAKRLDALDAQVAANSAARAAASTTLTLIRQSWPLLTAAAGAIATGAAWAAKSGLL